MGEYSVVVKNQFGSVTSMASLNVKAKPKGDSPKITQNLTPLNVKEGEKAEFVVKTTGTEPLDIQWNFNKKPIKSDKTYDISYNKGVATLKLAKALPENSGEYSVEMKNPFGSANSMASLKVQAKPKGESPKITQPLTSKNVKEGEKVEFVAKTTGTEPLDVQWTFNKKPIKSDRIHMITYFKGVASLKLTRAVPRNSGEYSVIVRNQYGVADSMASLKVQELKEEPK